LCALFLCLEVVFGFSINLAKSELDLVGNVNNADGLADILGFGVSSLSLKYLGFMLEASFKAKSIEEFKFHLLSWLKVCSLISMGGLGVRNMLLFNCAVLEKWLWHYMHERGLWRVMMDSKYGKPWGG
jgi:hypothetical protein